MYGVHSFVYNIKLTYKATAETGVEVLFVSNDGTGETTHNTSMSNGTVLPTASNGNNTIEIKATDGVIKCKTFKIIIREAANDTIHDSFVITDMAVIYRDKRIR